MAELIHKQSSELYRRALRVMPGGVNSPVRAMRQIGREPVFVARGEGCELVDVDGNRYIDWVCSWGPLILGHADPDVVAAVSSAAAGGTSYGAATEAEVELAEEVVARVPSVEMLRMTSSGTEAAMSAVRLARAVTEREVVVKFAGAYHGHSDGLLAEAGSGIATLAIPAGPGVPAAQTAGTVVVPWNDREAAGRALDEHPVAAVLVEPIAANMGVVPPAEGFLDFLRDATRSAGALLVFDEVITGFRVARGGAQELLAVEPDLTVMGKVLGGGLPAAAFGGPRATMERVAPAGDVYQAGTLSGSPLAVAAGLATLRRLDPAAYERLASLTSRLAEGLASLAADRPLTVSSAPGLVTLFFSDRRSATSPPRRPPTSTPMPLLPRHVGARCLSAAVTIRGLVRLARPRRGCRRQDARGGRRGSRGGSVVSRDPDSALRDLAAALREESTPISDHVAEPAAEPEYGRLAAAGPRAAAAPGEYAAVVEAIREGALLHYGEPRIVAGGDEDLALLAGDYLYALGIERLAAIGDSDAVLVLAELIAACAQAGVEGREGDFPELWREACHRIGHDGAGGSINFALRSSGGPDGQADRGQGPVGKSGRSPILPATSRASR